MMGTDLESLVDRLPFSKNTIISSGISWFIRRQDPETVEFDVYENGYQITVKTDEDNVKQAAEFWRDEVNPKLRGDNEE